MTKKMIIYLLFCSLLSLYSCEKNVAPHFPESPNNNLDIIPEIIWKTRLANFDFPCSNSVPYIYKDKVISGFELCEGGDLLMALNKQTGQLEWVWNEDNKYRSYFPSSFLAPIYQDMMIVSHKELVGIDLNTGTTRFTKSFERNLFRPISLIDDDIYASVYRFFLDQHQPYALRVSLKDLNEVDTVFTYHAPSSSNAGSYPAFEVISEEGQSILVIISGNATGPTESNVQINALDKNSLANIWVIDSLPDDDNTHYGLPVVVENIMVLPGEANLYGIDINNGQFLWQYPVPNGTLVTDFVVVEDDVLFTDNLGTLQRVDSKTGKLVNEWFDRGATIDHIKAYKGVLYYCSSGDGHLYATDATTGEIYWKKRTFPDSLPGASFAFTGVAIDEDLGYVYVADRYYLYCLKAVR